MCSTNFSLHQNVSVQEALVLPKKSLVACIVTTFKGNEEFFNFYVSQK